MNRRRPHRAVAAALLCALGAALGCIPVAHAETSGVQTVFTPTSGAGFVNPGAMYRRAATLHHNGDPNTPVWEPFLLMNNGRLIVYYSDQRQNSVHSQMLVHQTTIDGVTWGSVVQDVAYSAQSARPGMATVAQINGGQWIMTYEYCN